MEGGGECQGQQGRKGDHCPRAFYHSFRLPVRHGRVGLDGGAFPQQVGADGGDTCGGSGRDQRRPPGSLQAAEGAGRPHAPGRCLLMMSVVSTARVMEEWTILLNFSPKLASRRPVSSACSRP